MLFEAPVASGLLGHFVGAVSGGSLYRKASFLLDSLGQQVFSPHVQIRDVPDVRTRPGQQPVRRRRRGHARARDIVHDGVLQGYFLGSYSARKLGMRSTGNAGGNHNLMPGQHRRGLSGPAAKDGHAACW